MSNAPTIARGREYHAFIYESSLRTLIQRCPWFIEGYDCVITCIDSGSSTAREAQSELLAGGAWVHGQFVVVRGNKLVEVLNEHPIGFFDGFDEIYVVEPAAWRNIDPSVWKEHWTSERIHVDKGLPDSLLNMLWVSGAVRYASDGDGLNVVSAREEDVQRVIALFHGLRPAP